MAAAPGTGTEHLPSMIADDQTSLLMKLKMYLSGIDKDGPLTIYRMTLQHVKGQKIWEYGPVKPNMKSKVIMMVGETGSGKTSLINTMINYIFGVKWTDNHRIQLIAESGQRSEGGHSQTSSVTIYQINHDGHLIIPYSITIIDTPGFGCTRANKFDEETMQEIEEFLLKYKFTEVDAVCFVVHSSLTRLTSTQLYIYDNILSIFGNGMKDNIVFFSTFSDVQKPNVLSAVIEAGIPCARSEDGLPVYFKVNSGMLYTDNRPDEEDKWVYMANEIQWKMAMRSVRAFLLQFLPGKELPLPNGVLKEGDALGLDIDKLVQGIDEAKNELEEKESSQTEIQEDIKSENFQSGGTKNVTRKINSTMYSTNCHQCNSTCHQHCLVYSHTLVYFCEAFYWNGTCRVCGHGSRSHYSEMFYWANIDHNK